MKPLGALLALAGLGLAWQLAVAQDAPATRFLAPNLDSICEKDARQDVFFMASDEMNGRDTLSPETRMTAHYVKTRMQQAGLKPAGEKGTWYQEVALRYNKWDTPPALSLTTVAGERKLEYGRDFVGAGGPGGVAELKDVPLAFAGYAVNEPTRNYNDLDGLDLKGKLALVLRYEPTPWRQGGRRNPFSRASFLQTKEQQCKAAGAVGILLVTGPESLGATDNRRDLPDPGAGEKSPPLELDLKAAGAQPASFPFLHITIAAADALLGGEGRLQKLQQEFDQGNFANRPDLAGAKASLSMKATAVVRTCPNVLGKIEGERDEWIVFGAHHDHLGQGYFGSRSPNKMGEIHNGADDNASGVAAILEIAEAFATCGRKPRRSMLFITFTGEEKGLLGSQWYVKHPTVPHDRVVAMINIDMLGRLNNNEIAMQGTGASKFLLRHCQEAAPLFPELRVTMTTRAPIPASDHWPFFSEAGIPVLFPMGAIPPEMHTNLDDPETIKYGGIVLGARYMAEIAWRISEDPGYADYIGPVKTAVGPDGKPRDPSQPPPKKPSEAREEDFSHR
ncbi:MAG: M20/M25/M40 family metallo-hydrolase [Planctomycetes bacterium]|jgi:hypothetical protein|nr:M20/M25/M40 family metallo-hydrolase [Planctomycetota bacterium]MCL4731466.1 M20/M25/M40 family metallo-hydrolase [Planctomycetota bacterium]